MGNWLGANMDSMACSDGSGEVNAQSPPLGSELGAWGAPALTEEPGDRCRAKLGEEGVDNAPARRQCVGVGGAKGKKTYPPGVGKQDLATRTHLIRSWYASWAP